MRRQAAAVAAGRAAGAIPSGVDDEAAAKWLLGVAGRLAAAGGHVPRSYAGDLLLVRATGTRLSRDPEAEDFGWRRWISGTLTIAWIEASHDSIVHDTGGARSLGELIERRVARLRPVAGRKPRVRSRTKRTLDGRGLE